MPSIYNVRSAVPADLPHLPAVEASAAALFRAIPAVAHFADGGPSLSAEKQTELCAAGTLWVVTEQNPPEVSGGLAKPCAFLAAERMDSSMFIWELSVHADWQRRGLAGLLISNASDYAAELGLHQLSLMTERDVPWNGPMYARRGFQEVDPSQLGAQHLQIVEHEREDGMEMSRRVMMVLKVPH